MPIHFGMPTLIECPSLEQSLMLCSELGLDFVELNMNLPEYQLDQINTADAKQLFQQYGKYPTIHLDENLNVCDFNAAIADAYLNTVIQTISFAKELGAPIINMHMTEGVYFTLPDRKMYLFEQYKTQYINRLRWFRDACTTAIGNHDISICIENCGKYHDFQREGIGVLLESPCFALTYDIGHDFSVDNANEAFITSYADRLRHMHLHDATDTNNHLTLGAGKIDISDKLALAQKHNCRSVLETKTADALQQSVDYLRTLIKPVEVPSILNLQTPPVTDNSTNDEKLDLFQSLFKGREDVYARHWESKDGKKSGYTPACRYEWARGICEKPRVKCGDCKNRELIPLDRSVLTRHLSGKDVIGVYPILPEENCLFLAIDFDDGDWTKDIAALRAVCKSHEIPIAVERSRSGNGAHVWFFFDVPVSAYAARKFGSALLTAAMDQCHSLKFSSYDRFFPNQDTMPKGGFGNLIALPLQREARNNGNSMFIDEYGVPHHDQWAFLSGLRRLDTEELNRLTMLLSRDGELGPLHSESDENEEKPWHEKISVKLSAIDFPSEVQIVEANMLYM